MPALRNNLWSTATAAAMSLAMVVGPVLVAAEPDRYLHLQFDDAALPNGIPIPTSFPVASLPPDVASYLSRGGPVVTSNPESSGVLPPADEGDGYVTVTEYVTGSGDDDQPQFTQMSSDSYPSPSVPFSESGSPAASASAPFDTSAFDYSSPFYPSPFGGRALGGDSSWHEAYAKAYEFVQQLTIIEKVNLTSGTGWENGPCVGNTGDISRLGFQGLCMQDGPLGVRFADLISGFPCGLSSAATFNRGLMYNLAKAQALEHRAKGVDVMLGPVAGPIGLKAHGGRGWEGHGADPYLQGVGTSLAVRAIQDQGIIANAKHYIGNEQEHFRQIGESLNYGYDDIIAPLSSQIDDRSLHEIFAWPFADMVHSGVGSVMCSYNEVNGSQACQNSYLLNHVLKNEMGFPGFVMSDWNALKSGVAAILAGTDMSMPGGGLGSLPSEKFEYFGPHLTEAVYNGTVPLERLDDMATRIMAAYFKVGLDKSRRSPNFSSWTNETQGLLYPGTETGPTGQVNQHIMARTPFSNAMALQAATEATVLVKNDMDTLPFSAGKYSSISVIGVASRNAEGPDGFNCPDQGCSVGTLAMGWGSGAVNLPFLVSPLDGIMDRAGAENIRVFYYKDADTDTADFITAVTRSDVNVIVGLSDSGEGYLNVDGNMGDRNNISLWHNAENQILAAASLHPNNVVVINTVGPVNIESWIDHPNITAVIISPPQGEYAGLATTNVLFGDVNPSGRLPFTIPRGTSSGEVVPLVTDVPEDGKPKDPIFKRGLFLDYRYYDVNNIDPRFEFGFGMSYSKFSFDNFSFNTVLVPDEVPPSPPALGPIPSWNDADQVNTPSDALFTDDIPRYPNFLYPYLNSTDQAQPNGTYPYPDGYSETHLLAAPLAGGAPGGNPTLWDVCFQADIDVYNHGPFAGAHVAQLYLALPQTEKFFSAPRQLRGFEKVSIDVNGSSHVHFDIMRRDLSVWDSDRQTFIVQRGKYGVYVGSSSRDLELYAEFTIS